MKVELERAVAIQGVQENWILAIMPKYRNSAPGPQKMNFFRKFLIFTERSLNFASNEPLTTPDIKFKSSYARKLDFSLLYPKMEIQPMAPTNGIFQKKFIFFEKISRFRFQQTLNYPQTLSLSQVMRENVILAYYAQIWKFGPKYGTFQKNSILGSLGLNFHFWV